MLRRIQVTRPRAREPICASVFGMARSRSDLRYFERRRREQLLDRYAATDQALLVRVAGERLDILAVLLDAVAPEVLAHQLGALIRLGREPGERDAKRIDVAHFFERQGLRGGESLVER